MGPTFSILNPFFFSSSIFGSEILNNIRYFFLHYEITKLSPLFFMFIFFKKRNILRNK